MPPRFPSRGCTPPQLASRRKRRKFGAIFAIRSYRTADIMADIRVSNAPVSLIEHIKGISMQTYLLWAAAALCVVTFFVHVFIGGIHVVRPLLASKDITRASKWLNYYCWHIVSVVILFMAAMLAYASFHGEIFVLVAFMSALSVTLSVLSVLVAMKGGINPFRFPSTSMFTIISIILILYFYV